MYRTNKLDFMERLKDMSILISNPYGLNVYNYESSGNYVGTTFYKVADKCKECVNNKVCNIRPYERTIKNTFKIYPF